MMLNRSFTLFLAFAHAAYTGAGAQSIRDNDFHLRSATPETRTEESPFSWDTADPSDEDLARRHALVEDFVKHNDLASEREIVVPVCFHMMEDDPGLILNTRIRDTIDFLTKYNAFFQQQLDNLNAAFSNDGCCDLELPWCQELQNRGLYELACSTDTGFRFEMAMFTEEVVTGTTSIVARRRACKTITRKTEWNSFDLFPTPPTVLAPMMEGRRRGDASVLNVFFTRLGSMVDGYGTFPHLMFSRDGASSRLDGVVINTAPSTYEHGSNKTLLAHEVGHWLGLFHPYQSSRGCTNGGDWIVDTFPGDKITSCPVDNNLPDGCPGDEFPDPFMNIMNSATDACTYQFTPDQKTVMQAVWYRIRSTNLVLPEYETIELENGVQSEPITLFKPETQLYVYELLDGSSASSVTCTVNHIDGETGLPCDGDHCITYVADLILRWGGPPARGTSIDCFTTIKPTEPGEDVINNDFCSVEVTPDSQSLYVLVRPFNRAVQGTDIIVTCVEE